MRCAAAAAWLLAGAAPADEADTIARCAGEASLEERVTCLEAALREATVASDPDESGTAGQTPQEAPRPKGSGDAKPAESPPEPAPPESRRATVVSVGKTAYGKLVFTTAAGEVWQQTDRGRPRYPDPPFDVEIRGGAADSFFLRAVTGGVAVRVARSR